MFLKVGSLSVTPKTAWNGNEHPVRSPRDVVELSEQGVEDHRDGEVQHREEDRAIADEERSRDGARQRGRQNGENQQSCEVADAGSCQEGDAIGARGKEHGVADRYQSGSEQDCDAKRREAFCDSQGKDELKPGGQNR